MTVVPYSVAELIRLLSSLSEAKQSTIQQKHHKGFLEAYLAQLGVQTIVVEPDYIDRDFLRDYTGYYVSCFHAYRRTTARLHFFSSTFTSDHFARLLTGDASGINIEVLQSSYLGFIVVKPLSRTVIGRTCLKTYDADNGRRHFPATFEYCVNVAGIDLKVRSLAFQEQDTVAAACATSALWSCFHATGKQFHHPILSPTEITKAAAVSLPTNDIPDTRIFPNKGLTATQMANAINAVGLDPQIIGATNDHLLKSTVYAYLRCQVPVVLGIMLQDFNNAAAVPINNIGRHAVAVAGYSTGAAAPIPYGPTGFQLRASRLDRLYVHDDQLGPFARMVFKTVAVSGVPQPVSVLGTEWKSPAGSPEVVAAPMLMLLPLYQKIRIPFDVVHDTVLELDSLVEILRVQFLATSLPRLEWDIFLTTVNQYKKDVLSTGAEGKEIDKVLTKPLPKYLWCAKAQSNGATVCELVFDATGIEQSPLLLVARVFSPDVLTLLNALNNYQVQANMQTLDILESLAPNSSPKALVITP